jgi:HlyD family secretion protein
MTSGLMRAFAAATLALALAGCGRKDISVAATRVDRGPVRASVANTRAGTINACRRAKLAPSSGGQISVLHVHKGDKVQAQQILVELWNKDIQAQYQVAVNDSTATRARADEACTSARVARRDADRWISMRAQKLVAEDGTERAIGQADSSAAGCRAAKQNINVAMSRIDAASAALERTRIRAPFAGTVAEINGELGEFVTPSPVGIATPPTVDLIDNSCLYVSAPIDEVDAPSVRAGMQTRITLDAFQSQHYLGHVRRVAPYVLEAEKQARTVEIEAEIDSQTGRENLLPGYSADVEVVIATHANVLRVPTSAIIEGKRVLTVDAEGIVQPKDIKTGLGNWEFTEVLAGLAEQEPVITSIDREGVAPGAHVRVEIASTPVAAATSAAKR